MRDDLDRRRAWDDAGFFVVRNWLDPGSHVRADTAAELKLRWGPTRNAALASGSKRIVLEPGDVCVFDTWGVHRARYRHGAVRRTLDLLFGFGAPKVAWTGLAESY
jgi:hypothetical protein